MFSPLYYHDHRESGSERPFSFASFLFHRGCVRGARKKWVRHTSWQKCRIGHELSISRGSQWLFDEPSHPKGCPDSCPLMRRSSRREPPCLSVRLSVCRVAQDGRVVPLDGHPAIRCPPGAPANTLRPWAAAIALEPDDADTLDGKGAYAQVERAAGNRWCRAPASAGARNFRGRRHVHPLSPRRKGEPDEIDTRCAERAAQPPLHAPQPPRLAPSRRLAPPTPCLHAALAPQPFTLVCAQLLDVALGPRPGSREARRGGAAAAAAAGGAPGSLEEGDRAALGRAAAASCDCSSRLAACLLVATSCCAAVRSCGLWRRTRRDEGNGSVPLPATVGGGLSARAVACTLNSVRCTIFRQHRSQLCSVHSSRVRTMCVVSCPGTRC